MIATAISVSSPFATAAPPDAVPAPGDPHLCPRTDPDGLRVERLEGKRLSRAREAARRYECFIDVARRDGDWSCCTDDFVANRIRVTVRDRYVKRVLGTG